MLLHVRGVDLIAKEFQVHDTCYTQYVKEQGNVGEAQSNEESFDFESVKKYVQENVIELNQVVSLGKVHEIYNDGHEGDCRYRGKLKQKLENYFESAIKFVTIDKNTPQVIINTEGLSETTTIKNKDIIVNLAAKYLREDIQKFADEVPELSWPPTVPDLEHQEKSIPDSVSGFLETLLQDPGHPNNDKVSLLVRSYSNDLIHGVTKGKVMTLKHFLLGLGLHNLTGQKVPIQILSHLGHSVDYNVVCSIETAEARAAQEKSRKGDCLSLKPVGDETIQTVFWADNFNMHRDTLSGKAVLDITHIVAFQEKEATEYATHKKVSVPRGTKRSLSDDDTSYAEKPRINPKKEPSAFSVTNVRQEIDNEEIFKANKTVLAWSLLRLLGSRDQTLPMLSGWLMEMRGRVSEIEVRKTIETYLPPMSTSITDFGTIHQLFCFLQHLATEVNMPYVNITMDVGAAMNAYKVLWNFPDQFKNVMLHLGDFHCMKENFAVMGKLLAGSGFEDIAFQANLCSSGCLNGILNGSHYNRCWAIHELFYESLERLLLDAYIQEPDVILPDEFHTLMSVNDISTLLALLDQNEIQQFLAGFENYKSCMRNGDRGRTAQFWLVYYLDLMRNQHMMRTAVQENNYDLRRHAWEYMLPFYFGLNKTNYARYGTYYTTCMENIESLYPGNRQLIENKGLSVQGQGRYSLRTAIDQRGEQTINRDAKVAGGIKAFSSDEKSILKWTLNRASQAENTSSLRAYSNTEPMGDVYKQIRPSSIMKSEEQVQTLVKVMTTEYLNPFDNELCRDEVYNLSSGTPIDRDLAQGILDLKKHGESAHQMFVKDRLVTSDTKFHDPVKRNKLALFSSSGKKTTVKAKGKVKVLEANRDILAKLLAASTKHGRIIDFQKALEYPLTSVPLSLSNTDGSRRTNQKSELLKIILQNSSLDLDSSLDPNTSLPAKESVSAYIVDLMALVRTFTTYPATFEAFAMNVVAAIPKGYKRVDIVADAYLPQSIKSLERDSRGMAPRVIVQSAQSKLPRDFKGFLSNGDNKTRLIEVILNVLVSKKESILDSMNTEQIYFSSYKKCMILTREDVVAVPQLTSSQEEADTKVILHAEHALRSDAGPVIIRSPSGDVDIAIIALSHFINEGDRVVLDTNTGKHRKVFRLGDIDLTQSQKVALIGFHAFTGNDYNSAFFKKAKPRCWRVLETKQKFVDTFCNLGVSETPTEKVSEELEEFVSVLYGVKGRSVNVARHTLFEKKLAKQNKISDISLLPPCQQALKFHILRSNHIAREWRSACISSYVAGNATDNGWTADLELEWPEDMMPVDIIDIFVESDYEAIIGDSDESDMEDAV